MKKIDWIMVTFVAAIISWSYFWGTPSILGMDYFIHLAQADIVKQGIAEGNPIPAYHFLNGGGTTFIRYQGMLIAQTMGWTMYLGQKLFSLSDENTVVFAGRFFSILLNLLSGWVFLFMFKKVLKVYDPEEKVNASYVGMMAAAAYICGWPRLGEVLHIGSLQRVGALILYPVCFGYLLIFLERALSRKEQIVLGIAISCALLCHPAKFLYLLIICICFALVCFRSSFLALRLRWKDLLLPVVLSFFLCAWFIFPLVMEKSYYGLHRDFLQQQQIEKMQNKISKPWLETLPLERMTELVSRERWFGNAKNNTTDGSLLAGLGGVNSAYLGISVLLLSFLSLLLPKLHRKLGILAVRVASLTIIILIVLFWEGLRYNFLAQMGNHFALPFRWLAPLYFLFCTLVLFGACAVFLLLQKKMQDKAILLIMIGITFTICFDFYSVIFLNHNKNAYRSQVGKHNPLGINNNHGFFDSYEIIKNSNGKGRVLDVPNFLLSCNPLYHKKQSVLSEEPSTDWPEARHYDDLVLKQEVKDSCGFSFEYGSRNSFMDLLSNINMDSNIIVQKDNKIETINNWIGTTTLTFDFVPPVGIYKAWIVIPVYLPSNTILEATLSQHQNNNTFSKNVPGHSYFIIPFEHNSLEKQNYQLQIKINKKSTEAVIFYETFIAYNSDALAYRLSLLDVQFIAINKLFYSSPTGQFATSTNIRKLYESNTSVLYQNFLSTFFIIPKKVYVIDEPLPAKLFNKDICHHPNYNPHQISFCYQGTEQEFDGKINQENWEQTIAPMFLEQDNSKNTQDNIQAQFVELEKIVLDINMTEERFVFLALRYHPNLQAVADGKMLKIYQAQANTIALKLPQGSYQMSIHYHHPWYDTLGKSISILTILILILMCGYNKLKPTTK